MDNLPSLRDTGGPLGELPPELRLHLFNDHFAGAKDKSPISVRPDDNMLKAMTTLLLEIKSKGGVPWLQSQSDLLRAGLGVLLLMYGYYVENPPPQLLSIITAMKMEGEAKVMAHMEQALDNTIMLRSKQCAQMVNDPAAQSKLCELLTNFVEDILKFDEYWQSRYVTAALEDRHIFQALKKFDLLGRLE